MNIILVPGKNRPPRNFDLSRWAVRRRFATVALMAILVFAAAGGAAALWLFDPRDGMVVEIEQLRQQIQLQRDQLAVIHQNSERQVNALAQQLGELEAQSMRVNALGERLTEISELDDGEFDFSHQPAIGGAEGNPAGPGLEPPDLRRGIQDLTARFATQEAQLRVLEDLLLDHEVASRQRPTGMPVTSGYISSYYGSRIDPFTGHATFHHGLDFATKMGSDVLAVAEGIVSYAGVRSGYGNVVEIDHGNGYVTRYAHNSKLLVAVGEHVDVGQPIATAGSTGRSTGPHVHFEVWNHGRSVNPLAYVRSHRE